MVDTSPVRAMLLLSRLRYRSYNLPPFLVGVLGSGNRDFGYLVLGSAAIAVYGCVQELANTVSDRVEDAIDYPERTALAQSVGYRRISQAVVVLVGAYLGLVGAMLLGTTMRPIISGLWIGTLVGALGYSYGPKLKARTYGSLVLNSLAMVVFLVAGWRAAGDTTVYPYVVMLLSVRASCAGLGYKDLPNLEGDAAIGYRSLSVLVRELGSFVPALLIALVPYGVALGFGAAGSLGPRYYVVVALLPATAVMFTGILRARERKERFAVREFTNLYQLTWMALVLWLLWPTVASALISFAAVVWFLVATRTLHPEPGLIGRSTLRLLVSACLRRPAARLNA